MKVSAIETLALAALAVALGEWLRARIAIIGRLHIPPSIAGGLVFALVNLILHQRGFIVDFDASFRDPLMLTCFAIIGFNSSLRVLRRGGKLIVLLLVMATVGGALQNVVGSALAKAFGLSVFVGPLEAPYPSPVDPPHRRRSDPRSKSWASKARRQSPSHRRPLASPSQA